MLCQSRGLQGLSLIHICKEVQPDRAVYQFPGLLLRYRNDLHWGRFDQAMERMETMAALALSVVLRECKQMGTAQMCIRDRERGAEPDDGLLKAGEFFGDHLQL